MQMQSFSIFALFFVSALLLYGLFAFFNYCKEEGARIAAERQAENQAGRPEESQQVDGAEDDEIIAPFRIGDSICVYQYKNIRIALFESSELHNKNGDDIFFREDNGRVLATTSYGVPIGYVEDEIRARMIFDWFKKGDPIYAAISCVNTETRDVSCNIYFYRNQLKYELTKNQDAQPIRLVENRARDIQGSASACLEGDACTLEYDLGKGKFAVINYYGLPVGYLPKSAEKLFEEYGPECADVYVGATEIDDDGNTVVYVYIF